MFGRSLGFLVVRSLALLVCRCRGGVHQTTRSNARCARLAFSKFAHSRVEVRFRPRQGQMGSGLFVCARLDLFTPTV